MPCKQNGAGEKFCRAALLNSIGDFARHFAGARHGMAIGGKFPVTPVKNVSA
jgi:hypothetical protein